ncbi:hypothetical protein NTGBS_820047 [Candidatus Nitrotoga sp. BS]|nr:hypothetical protein NTGBS_820047 [Candidatus Nitrotoga sp. BS]
MAGGQVVGGSNPLAPTNIINGLQPNGCKPFYFLSLFYLWVQITNLAGAFSQAASN